MGQEELKMIVDLVNGLGKGGIWAVVLVYAMQPIKTIIGWAALYLGFKQLTNLVLNYCKYSIENDNKQLEKLINERSKKNSK